VSSVLNMGDGFLGKYLKVHLVLTCNTATHRLDSAILRPGRLIGTREFRRLTTAEALRLANAKGLKLPDQPDYSLAEIYCSPPVTLKLNSNRQIGFGVG